MISLSQNILIIRTDRIGDVVLTTPTVKALRKAYPQARIAMLVAPLTKDLVAGNVDLDEVIVDDRQGAHQGLGGFLILIRALRRKKFDVAIVLHTKKRTNALCFLAGIPRRIGYKNNKFGFLLTRPLEDGRHHGQKHEAQYCLDVLKPLGIESHALEVSVSVQARAEQWVKQFCQDHHIGEQDQLIAIHPGASDPAKCWPEYRFAELIDEVVKKYPAKVVIVGAVNTQAMAQKIRTQAHHPLLDLTGKTSVSQLTSVLKRCQMFISNDSGPVHIAAGLGTPVVSIFTRNQPGINPERWHPLGAKSKVVAVTSDISILNKKAQVLDPQYAELIDVATVLEAVDALFKLC